MSIDFHGTELSLPDGLEYWVPLLNNPQALLSLLANQVTEAKSDMQRTLGQLDPSDPHAMALDYAVLRAGINLLDGIDSMFSNAVANLHRARLGGAESMGV